MTKTGKNIAFIAIAALFYLADQPVKADSTFDFDLSEYAEAAQGDEGHTASMTGEGRQGMGANVTSNATAQQSEASGQVAQLGLLAPGSLGGETSFPSGQWSFGFSGGGSTMFSTAGGALPATSTSSVDGSITSGW